jgi:hypothetical protein
VDIEWVKGVVSAGLPMSFFENLEVQRPSSWHQSVVRTTSGPTLVVLRNQHNHTTPSSPRHLSYTERAMVLWIYCTTPRAPRNHWYTRRHILRCLFVQQN